MKKNLCWTADGQQIVFAREYGIEYCICSIHPDGSGRTVTVTGDADAVQPFAFVTATLNVPD